RPARDRRSAGPARAGVLAQTLRAESSDAAGGEPAGRGGKGARRERGGGLAELSARDGKGPTALDAGPQQEDYSAGSDDNHAVGKFAQRSGGRDEQEDETGEREQDGQRIHGDAEGARQVGAPHAQHDD